MVKNKCALPHLKLGATSFLIQEDYVPAIRFVAEQCEDIALLLVETGDHGELLPSRQDIREIAAVCDGEGVSVHVHLPTDADFDSAAGARKTVADVRTAVERAAPLCPHSFVLHVDFPSLQGVFLDTPKSERSLLDEARKAWTAAALRDIADCLPAPEQLAVENLETYPPDFWDEWVEGFPYSRCLDVGHVWKDGADPAPILNTWLPDIRVIHLHGLKPRNDKPQGTAEDGGMTVPGLQSPSGIKERLQNLFGPHPRDHTSLRLMPEDCIDAVVHPLWDNGFAGILTLEVFSYEDFTTSHEVLLRSWERYLG